MSRWTLRPQAKGGANGSFSAADRAAQYVRRHGWQFHGARVAEALTSPVTGHLGETAHGLTVVGWKGENGLAHCPEHRPRGGTMITSATLESIGTLLCIVCGGQLRGTEPAFNAVCVCTHPYATHNVNGLCIALPGVLGCGCVGWSEVRP